jgi:hypothetical protein
LVFAPCWAKIGGMASHDYHFVTEWNVAGTLEEISDALGDAPALARWWSSVYLEVEVLEPGAADGLGRVVRLHTRGWLPYTLDWRFRVIESRRPHGFALQAWGDFVGRGEWRFEQRGERVQIRYDWRIRAEKPLLRWLSFALKPIFSLNHRWAMEQGERALPGELARRRAAAPAPGPAGRGVQS